MKIARLCSALIATVVLTAIPAAAQQRPLLTQDPETIGSGVVLVEGGLTYGRSILFPASGLQGNLLQLPLVGVSVGVGSIAEIQIDGGPYDRLSITSRTPAPLSSAVTATGNSTHDVDNLVFATKIRVLSETPDRPSVGIRFATTLPDASPSSGLGLDTTNFDIQGLVGKTVHSVRVVGNVGLAILGDPTDPNNQNDAVDYGISVARAIQQGVEVVGELNGRASISGTPPPGTESRGEMRLGGRVTRGTVRLDGALIIGMTPRDPSFGVTVGATWVFKAFTVQ